jgi:hypothetical protein
MHISKGLGHALIRVGRVGSRDDVLDRYSFVGESCHWPIF